MKGDLNIGQVAQATGLTAHTLRYYERIGLLLPVGRDPVGRRRFAARDLEWIAFLQRLRTLGMPIGDMCAYAALRRDGDSTVKDRRVLLQKHLDRVRREMAALEDSAQVIANKITLYQTMEENLSPSSSLEKDTQNDDSANNRTDDQAERGTNKRTLRTRTGQTARD